MQGKTLQRTHPALQTIVSWWALTVNSSIMWVKSHIHGVDLSALFTVSCSQNSARGRLLTALPDPFLLICFLTQNPEEAEVRLRSYSYSSPKAKPSRPLLNRDATVTDLAEGEWTLTPLPCDLSVPGSQLNGHMRHMSNKGEDQTGVINQLNVYKVYVLACFDTDTCECLVLRPCFVLCRWCIEQQQSFPTSSFISL